MCHCFAEAVPSSTDDPGSEVLPEAFQLQHEVEQIRLGRRLLVARGRRGRFDVVEMRGLEEIIDLGIGHPGPATLGAEQVDHRRIVQVGLVVAAGVAVGVYLFEMLGAIEVTVAEQGAEDRRGVENVVLGRIEQVGHVVAAVGGVGVDAIEVLGAAIVAAR